MSPGRAASRARWTASVKCRALRIGSLAPIELSAFLNEIEKLCRKLAIEIEVADDRRVYCLNLKLQTAVAGAGARVH